MFDLHIGDDVVFKKTIRLFRREVHCSGTVIGIDYNKQMVDVRYSGLSGYVTDSVPLGMIVAAYDVRRSEMKFGAFENKNNLAII